MELMLILCSALVALGVLAWAGHRLWPKSTFYGSLGGTCALCSAGACAAATWLFSGHTFPARPIGTTPLGSLWFGLDSLSLFFLFCVCLISALAALYGLGYLGDELKQRRLGPALFFFNLLVASMIGVVLAGDAISFLLAWEMMLLSSLFLVGEKHEQEEVRRATVIYLVASHVGGIFVFLLFALLARHSGTYRFDLLAQAPLRGGVAAACFALALLGFGTKAGFWVLHVWLPEAHPAAPSHVSALMSGAMIKLGIYGLLRMLMWIASPPQTWGCLLIVIGAVSGLSGVIQALGQHDLKRLLAYHSIENIGIIVLGLGVGLLGQSGHQPAISFLGYGGALLHVLNHGLFKGLLFQGAGSVLRATGTRNMEAMGGLLKRMPLCGSTFLVGSAAISGLPPLNGFVSEWLIFLGLFLGVARLPGMAGPACAVGIASLAFISGLAASCFVKAFGIVFLGEPRSLLPKEAVDPGWAMKGAMTVGAGLCFAIGLWPQAAVRLAAPAVGVLLSASSGLEGDVAHGLGLIARCVFGMIGLCGLLLWLRRRLLRRREIRYAPTWSCGYPAPTPRMQYTASSFAQPLLQSLKTVLRQNRHLQVPQGYFPTAGHFSEHLTDRSLESLWVPSAAKTVALFQRLKFMQQGKLPFYLLYILVTLILLLLWKIR